MYRKQLQDSGLGMERHSSMPEITRDEFLEKQKTLQRKSSFGSTESVRKRVTKTKVSSRLLQPTASTIRKQKEKKQYVPTERKKSEVLTDRIIKSADSGYTSQTFTHYGEKPPERGLEEIYIKNNDENEFHEKFSKSEKLSNSREVQSDSEGVYKSPARSLKPTYASDAEYESNLSYFSDADKPSKRYQPAKPQSKENAAQVNTETKFQNKKTFSSIINNNNKKSVDSDNETKIPFGFLSNENLDTLTTNRDKTTVISTARSSLHESKTFQYVYTIDAELSYREYNKLMTIITMLQEQKRKWEEEVEEIRDKLEKTGKEKMQLAHNNHILRQSLEAANRAIQEINGKVQELKQSLIPLREENTKLHDDIGDKDEKIQKLKDEKINAINETHELKKAKSNLEQKTIALEKEYEKYKSTMHEKFKNLEETYRVYQIDMEKNNTQNLEGIDDLRQRNEQLTVEVNALKLDYKRMENELEKTKVMKENLEYQNSNIELDTKREIEKLETTCTKEKTSLKEEIQELTIEISRQKKEILEIEKERNNVLNDFQSLKNDLKTSTDSNSSIEKLYELEKEKNVRLHNQIEEMKIELQHFYELKIVNENLNNEKSALNEKIFKIDEEIYEYKSNVDNLRNENSSLRQDIESLNRRLENYDLKEVESVEKSQYLNEEIRQYKEQIINFRNIENENDATKRELERLETRLVSSQKQITDLSLANQQSVAAKDQMEIELAKLQRKLNERPTVEYLDELRREISGLQVDINESNKRVIEESSQNEDLKRELEEITTVFKLDQQVLQNENLSLKKQIDKLSNDITELDRDKRQETSDKERIAIELELLKRELDRKPSDNETEQWKNEITQLRMEILDVQQKFHTETNEKENYIIEISEMKNKHETNNQLQENQIENLKKQVKELSHNLTSLDKSKQNEISERKQVEYQLDQVKRELSRKPSDIEINNFKNEISQLKSVVSETNNQLTIKISEIENLTTQINGFQEKLVYQESLVEREKETHVSQMNRLTSDIDVIEKEKQNEMTNRKRLELELEQIKRELNRKPSDTEIGNWKSEITRLRSEISEINKLKYRETAHREQLKNEYDELQSKFHLHKQLNENEISSLKDQVNRLKIDINEIDTQKHEEITQRQLLEREITLLKNELSRKPQDKELRHWQDEIARLKTSINELTKEKNEEKMNKDKLQIEIDDLMKNKQRGDTENKSYFDEINKLKIKVIQIDEEKNIERKEKLQYERELKTLRETLKHLQENQKHTTVINQIHNNQSNSKTLVTLDQTRPETGKSIYTQDKYISAGQTKEIDMSDKKQTGYYSTTQKSTVHNQHISNKVFVEEKIISTEISSVASAPNTDKYIKENDTPKIADSASIMPKYKDSKETIKTEQSDVSSTLVKQSKNDASQAYTKLIDGKIASSSNDLASMISSLVEESTTYLNDEKTTSVTKDSENEKLMEKKRKMKEIEDKIKRKREQEGIWALKTPSIDSLTRKSTDTLENKNTASKEILSSQEAIKLKEKIRKRDRSSSAQRSHSADPKQYEPVGRPLKSSMKRERGRSPQRRNRTTSSENFKDSDSNNMLKNTTNEKVSANSIDQLEYSNKMTSSSRSASQRSSTQKLTRGGEMSAELSVRERRKRSEERRRERLKNQSNQQDSSNDSQEDLREKRLRRRSKGRSKESLERGETNEREDFITQAMLSRQQASTTKPGMRAMHFRESDTKEKRIANLTYKEDAMEKDVRKDHVLSRNTSSSKTSSNILKTTNNAMAKNYGDKKESFDNEKTDISKRHRNDVLSNRDYKDSTYTTESEHKQTKDNFSSENNGMKIRETVNEISRNNQNNDRLYWKESFVSRSSVEKTSYRQMSQSGKNHVNNANNASLKTVVPVEQKPETQRAGVTKSSDYSRSTDVANNKNVTIATTSINDNTLASKYHQSKNLSREESDIISAIDNRPGRQENRNLSFNTSSSKTTSNVSRSYTTPHDPRYATVDRNFKYSSSTAAKSTAPYTSNGKTITKETTKTSEITSSVSGNNGGSNQRHLSESELEQMRRMEEARQKVLMQQQSVKTTQEKAASHSISKTTNENGANKSSNGSLNPKQSKQTTVSVSKESHDERKSVKDGKTITEIKEYKNVITVGGQPLERDSQENINKMISEGATTGSFETITVDLRASGDNLNKGFRNNASLTSTKETTSGLTATEMTSIGYNSYRSLPRNMKPLQQSISKQISVNSQKQSQSTNALTKENLEMHQSRSYRDIKLHENMQRRSRKMAQYKDNNSHRLSAFSNDSLGGFSQVTFATLSDEGKQYEDYATQYDGAIQTIEHEQSHGTNSNSQTSHVQHDFHERDILKFARNIPKGHSKFNCEKCRELNMQRRGNQPIRFCWERYFPISESTPQPSMQSLLIK